MDPEFGEAMAETGSTTIQRDTFRDIYTGGAPWDIGRPQPALVTAAGDIKGAVLDVGCGTGENSLFFASRGCEVTGIDFLEQPIAAAKRKAAERGLSARFLVKDALRLREWEDRFDTILDSGLFHVFSDEDRVRYVNGLHAVLKPRGRLFLLCFSELTPGTQGPRRVSEKELRESFHDGWEIERLERAEFEVRTEAIASLFSGENPKAWFMVAGRVSADL